MTCGAPRGARVAGSPGVGCTTRMTSASAMDRLIERAYDVVTAPAGAVGLTEYQCCPAERKQ